MAFSQKHGGKVFVPWFNTEEWRSVYNLLTSNSPENMKKALVILKIWKNRTSLLSAGVEGTLILLETLLADFTDTPEHQIIQIYSITLLRFLNICAANSNKQGTFNKTVSKNDLPKWLIDIRHDIAHDNKLPSKPILELAVSHSLQWLIQKYWQIQNQTISDFVVNTEISNSKILDSLNAYVRLNVNLYRGVDLNEYDEALMEKINYLASKRYNKSRTDTKGLLMILEEILKQALSDPNNKNIANKVAEILVDEKVLLATHLETTEEGKEIIPLPFKKLWLNLLNILYENDGFLSALFDQLWLFICNSGKETIKKIASAWVCDLLNGLLKLQALRVEVQASIEKNVEQIDVMTTRLNLKYKLEKKFPDYHDCTDFESLDKLFLVNLNGFENKILENPNIYVIKFLDKAMKFNKSPDQYRILMTTMIKEMYERAGRINNIGFSNVFTINDLSIDMNSLEIHLPVRIEQNCPINDNDVIIMIEENVTHVKRWNLVQDTLLYQNCPLGLLPHQSRSENPLAL